MVDAADLVDHPENWRVHGDEQRHALKAVLNKVGIADAVVAFERKTGRGKRVRRELVLIDGHLRKEELEGEVPVLVLDVNEEEAQILLASHDAIGKMADIDEPILSKLLERIAKEDEQIAELSQSIREEYALWDEMDLPTSLEASDVVGESAAERSVLAINFPSNDDATAFLTKLGFDEKEARMRKIPGELLLGKLRAAGVEVD